MTHTKSSQLAMASTSRCLATEPNNVLCFCADVSWLQPPRPCSWRTAPTNGRLKTNCLQTHSQSPNFHSLFDWLNSSQSHITTDGQSASQSWCQAPSGAKDQIFVTVRHLRFCDSHLFYKASARTQQKTTPSIVPLLSAWCVPLLRCCLFGVGPRRKHRFQHVLYCCVTSSLSWRRASRAVA
jgi:hypothetical protein